MGRKEPEEKEGEEGEKLITPSRGTFQARTKVQTGRRERNPRRSRGYGRINEPLIESKVRANEARVEGARQNKRRID